MSTFLLQMDARRVRFGGPGRCIDDARIAAVAATWGVDFEAERVGETCTVTLCVDPSQSPIDVDAIFADVHGYPRTPGVDLRAWRTAENPRMSCVVLTTANDRFVRRHMLACLAHSLAGNDAEIIVVYNGPPTVPLPNFGNIPVMRSDFAAVARGYNAGVAASRGEYVAIFHDDVLMFDPRWVEKCIAALSSEVVAVSPEVQHSTLGPGVTLPVAKGVPLVMRRCDHDRLGGHDEFFLAGIEDLDLSHRILAEGGRIEEIKLETLHFNGMSTIIAFGDEPMLFRRIFGHHLLGMPAIRALQGAILSHRQQDPQFQPLSACYMQHFLEKYQAAPNALDVSALADGCRARACGLEEKEALEARIRAGFSADVFAPLEPMGAE